MGPMVHPYRTALRDLDRFNTKLWGFFNGLKNQANTWRTGSQKPANVAPPPRAVRPRVFALQQASVLV